MKLRLRKLVALALVFAMLATVLPMNAIAVNIGRGVEKGEQAQGLAPVYPAISQAIPVDDELTVTVEAEEGAFPAGTAVTAEKVALENVQKAVDDTENVDGTVLYAVDITFTKDGAELQPAEGKSVFVRFSAPDLSSEASVVHIDTETNEAEPVDTVDTEAADEVAFEAAKFSIYAIVGPQTDYPRLKIVFKQGETEIADMYLKKSDVELGHTEMIIYDPGVPQADGQLFNGWTTIQNYDLNTEAISLAQIRSDAETRVNAGVTDGTTVTYYAMMSKVAYLHYEDEAAIVFKSDIGKYVGDSVTLTVNADYTPTGVNRGLIGWVKKGTTAPVYKNGSSITISEDTTLVPLVGEGYWISFDENDGGSGTGQATYTPPVFVPGGETAAAYRPGDPTRPGYDFDNWYTSAAGGTLFNFDQLLSGDVTVYAGWTPKQTASYKVVIWAQKVTDDKNTADAQKKYDYIETINVPNVATGKQITDAVVAPYTAYGNDYFGATDLAHGSKAFQYRTYEIKNGIGNNGDCVSATGNTVVNVYYDRKLMTIMFSGAQGGTMSTYYEQVEEPTSDEVYAMIDGEPVLLGSTLIGKKLVPVKNTDTNTTYTNTTVYRQSDDKALTLEEILAYSGNSNLSVGTIYKRMNKDANNYTLTTSTGSAYSSLYIKRPSSNQTVYLKVQGVYGYTLNGELYEGPFYEKKTVNAVIYTGLYGQTLEQNGYTWPSGNWKSIAYLSSFNGNLFGDSGLGSTPNKIVTTADNDLPNTRIIFYMQDAESGTTYTEAGWTEYYVRSDQGFNITQRFIGAEPTGYRWSTSATMPTGWDTGRDNEGRTSIHRGSNTYLHIKYDRVKNDIVYKYGDDVVKTIGGTNVNEKVPYGKSLSGYESTTPTAQEVADRVPEGQYFVGWYEDPEGVNRADWSGTMPLGNKTLYAKALPVRYHVLINLNGGELPPPPEGQQQTQKLSFWVDYQTVLDDTVLKQATKTENGKTYSLVGYFTDEDCTKPWLFSTKLTDENMAIMYDGPDDPARVPYGDNGWADTVGVFKLYAKWRDDTIAESGGLTIRYQWVDKNNVTKSREDPLHYADQALVVAGAAPLATDLDEDLMFESWQLGTHAYRPTETFYADSALAVQEGSKLVITLTANLGPKEKETPTHIDWYSNIQSVEGKAMAAENFTKPDGAKASDYGWVISDANLQINEEVEIPAFDTYAYPGYTFLGWGKSSSNDPTQIPITEDVWIEWDAENEVYKAQDKTGDWVTVTHVAADEMTPYDNLFAIWQAPPTFTVYYSSEPTKPYEVLYNTYKDSGINLKDGVADVLPGVHDGYYYGGYYTEEPSDWASGDPEQYFWDSSAAGPKTNPGTKMVPIANATYYVKEVDASKYLKLFYKYTYVKKTKRLTGLWVMTCLDDLNYEKAGYKVFNATLGESEDTPKTPIPYTFGEDEKTYKTVPIASAYKTIRVKAKEPNGDVAQYVDVTRDMVCGCEENEIRKYSRLGYLSIYDIYLEDFAANISNKSPEIRGKASYSVVPYWETLDGVEVYAKNYRTYYIHVDNAITAARTKDIPYPEAS